MTRFLICTMPMAGHVTPAVPIARRLVGRGHDVWWYGGRTFETAVTATGALFRPMHPTIDFDHQTLEESFPVLRGRRGLARTKTELRYCYIDAIPRQIADLSSVLEDFPADVILADQVCSGAGLTAELRQIPWANFGVTALTFASRDTAPFGAGLPPVPMAWGQVRNRVLNTLVYQLLFADLNAHYQRVRAAVGLSRGPGYFDAISPFLFLQPTVAAFEYPRSDLPPQVHFIGALLPPTPARSALPPWWPEANASTPLILVTQGTFHNDPSQLVVPATKALANARVWVVATTGRTDVRDIPLTPLPRNARVGPFTPFEQVMPAVDLMLTNGGYGAVQFALAHGIPIVVAPSTEEKNETAMRVAWSGVGLNLRTGSPRPAQIAAAAHTILTSSHYRTRARELQLEFARHTAPDEAADLLEQLAATCQPVLSAPAPATRPAASQATVPSRTH